MLFLSQQAVSIFYLHKRGAPLGAGPKAEASLASPKGRPWSKSWEKQEELQSRSFTWVWE